MNATKDLILEALRSKEEFLVEDGKLYKKFTRIEVEQKTETVTRRVGMFRTYDEIIKYFVVSSFFGDTLVYQKRIAFPVDFGNGDILNLHGFGGIIEVDVNAS
jgi:hypothetical protein